jgi:hypothetical protein
MWASLVANYRVPSRWGRLYPVTLRSVHTLSGAKRRGCLVHSQET